MRRHFWFPAALYILLSLLPLTSVHAESAAIVGVIGDSDVMLDGREARLIRATGGATEPLQTPAGWVAPASPAVAQTGDSLILVGGLDANRTPVRTVSIVSRTGATLVVRPLADLPAPTSGAGAYVLGDSLYVVGGLQSDGNATNELHRIAWTNPGATWETLESLPGAGRVFPAVTGSFQQLHVIGGRTLTSTDQWTSTDEVWTYRPRPIDGTTITGWVRAASVPVALAGAQVAPTGQSHTLLVAADVRPVVSDPLDLRVSSGRSITPITYHCVTDTWAPVRLQAPPPDVTTGVTLVSAGGTLRLVDPSSPAGPTVTPVVVPRPTSSLRLLDWVAIAAYFVGMAGIGVYFARKQNSSDEFSLGSRNVKWWAGAISMYATGVSSISLMAIPVMGFTSNLVFLFPVLFMIPQAVVQARLLVPLLRRLEITSTYEYLERRFNTPLRLLASAQCISLQAFGRMSIVLLLPSLALSAATGLNVYVSILLMGVLTTIYTAVGGFEAVVWTDVVQGVIMFFGPIAMIIYAVKGVPGGLTEIVHTGVAYGKFDLVNWTWNYTFMAAWIPMLAALMSVAGFAGDQPVVQRVYATPLRDVRRLQYFYNLLGLLVAALVTAVGLALFFFYRANPTRLDPNMSNDQLVPRFIVDVLPAGVSGIMVAAIFAAAMSTMSSSMNSVSVLVSEDFYRRFFPAASDARRLHLMKRVSYFVGVVGIVLALWMATFDMRSIFETWNRLAALLGGGFVGIYALGMFTRRANGIGAFAGAVASVVWTIFAERFTSMHWSLLGPTATLACIVVGYVVSLFSGAPTRDLTGLTIFTARSTPRPDPVVLPAAVPV